MSARFEIEKNPDGKWHWRLLGDDEDILLVSEIYESRQGAENGIDSVRRNAADDGRYDRRVTTDGRYYFVLKGANHEIVGTNPPSKTPEERDRNLSETKVAAPSVPVEMP